MQRKIFTYFFIIIVVLTPILIIASAHVSNFHARRGANNEVILEWNTESETNIARFDIKCSVDKITWQKIGSIPSK